MICIYIILYIYIYIYVYIILYIYIYIYMYIYNRIGFKLVDYHVVFHLVITKRWSHGLHKVYERKYQQFVE